MNAHSCIPMSRSVLIHLKPCMLQTAINSDCSYIFPPCTTRGLLSTSHSKTANLEKASPQT